MNFKPGTIMGLLTLMLSFGTALGTIYGKAQTGISENRISISENKGAIKSNDVKIEDMKQFVQRIDENLEYLRRNSEKK